MVVRPFADRDRDVVVALWQACGLITAPNDPREDMQLAQRTQPELFLVGEDDGTVVATAMAGFDGGSTISPSRRTGRGAASAGRCWPQWKRRSGRAAVPS